MALFGKDYDSVQVGGYRALPAGGYICRILGARTDVTANEHLPKVVVMLDIVDGEYSNYFSNKFEDKKNNSNDPQSVKFPGDGVAHIVAVDRDGNTKKSFKGFCTSVEQSNGIRLPRDNDAAFINMLRGKEVGVLFGREEWMGSDGEPRWSTKPRFFRDVDSIIRGDFTVPEDRPLNNSYSTTQTMEAVNSLFGDMPTGFAEVEGGTPF